MADSAKSDETKDITQHCEPMFFWVYKANFDLHVIYYLPAEENETAAFERCFFCNGTQSIKWRSLGWTWESVGILLEIQP